MIELLVNEQLVELSEDFQILINKSIADIRNPENRSSDWSKTITIPGTSVNNKLFGHLFEVGDSITGTSFNPNKKANCTVLLDGMEQMRGFIRLTQINVLDNDDIEYQATIHGESANLFTDIENAKLSDLDFSEYNHVLNIQNIKDSWDSQIYINGSTEPFEYGVGYVWSQILPKRASNNANYDQWRTSDHTPCLYAKTVVDKIFSVNGYSYSSDSFFTTDRFKRLIVPFSNEGLSTGQTAISERLFYAGVSSGTTVSSGGTFPIDDDSSGNFYDNGSNYDTGTYKYTTPVPGNYTFTFQLDGSLTILTPLLQSGFASVIVDLYVNSTLTRTALIESTSTSTTNWTFSGVTNFVVDLAENDEVYFVYRATEVRDAGQIIASIFDDLTLTTDTQVYNTSNPSTIQDQGTVDFGYFFDQDHTQKDFILSLVRMFNLYIEQLDDGTLRFVPRDEFYDGSNVDWSQKLDYNQAHEILPMGELQNNPYVFSYAEGSDIQNEQYQESSARIYGDRTIRVDNDFIKDEKKIEVKFEPTQFIETEDNRFYSICSTEEGEKAGGLRILYYAGTKTLGFQYNLYTGSTPGTRNINYYPVSTHVDDPYDMSFDLLWGMPTRINTFAFTYSNQNLINVYYYRTLAEIIDKDSKLFRGYFRITPAEFQKLRFNSLYFFEGQYWKLNKIVDYDPQSEGLTKCEFLLSVFYEPSSTGSRFVGEGGFDTDNVYNPDLYPPQGRPKFLPSPNSSDGVNIGDNIGSGGDSVLVGSDILNAGVVNTIVGSSDVINTFDNVTALNCSGYEIPEGDRVYVENHPVVGAWLGSGKVVNIDDTDSPYSATYDDWLILCDTTSGSITVTLPTPTDANKGKMYVVKKTQSANQVTINAGDGSVLIDDAISHTDNAKNGYDQVVSDGTQYWIITHGH
jgi:hypothetical protein